MSVHFIQCGQAIVSIHTDVMQSQRVTIHALAYQQGGSSLESQNQLHKCDDPKMSKHTHSEFTYLEFKIAALEKFECHAHKYVELFCLQ